MGVGGRAETEVKMVSGRDFSVGEGRSVCRLSKLRPLFLIFVLIKSKHIFTNHKLVYHMCKIGDLRNSLFSVW